MHSFEKGVLASAVCTWPYAMAHPKQERQRIPRDAYLALAHAQMTEHQSQIAATQDATLAKRYIPTSDRDGGVGSLGARVVKRPVDH